MDTLTDQLETLVEDAGDEAGFDIEYSVSLRCLSLHAMISELELELTRAGVSVQKERRSHSQPR